MKFLLAFFINICCLKTIAQQPAYYQITDEDGLPSNEIYSILQDDFGYIWIGCDAGLYKYDGFTFQEYANSKQNGRSVSFLHIDNKQRVWCKNFFGQIYRVDGDSLKIIKSFQTSNPAYPQFAIDKDNNIWTYAGNKLIQCNENGNILKDYTISHSCDEIVSLKYFDDNIYIIFKDLSAVKFNIKKQNYQYIGSTLDHTGTTQSCMIIEHKNALYILSELNSNEHKYTICKIHDDTISIFHQFNLPNKDERVYSIFSDKKDFWVSTSFGAFKLHEKEHKLFDKEKISHMLIDREGQHWFSSLQGGLFVVPHMDIIRYDARSSELIDNQIMRLKVTSDKHLLMGSYQGNVFEMDMINNSINEKYQDSKERFISIKFIEQNDKYTIISRGRFCIIDNTTGKQFFPQISNIRDAAIIGDTVYLLQSGFVAKASLSMMTRIAKTEYEIIKNEGGRAIEYDKINNLLYILSGDGLYYFKPNEKWTEVLDKDEKISGSTIQYFGGIVWVASIKNGVYGIVNKEIKYHFSINNQLVENDVRTIETDGKDLWVCTKNYLHRMDLVTKNVQLFSTTQSINTKDINAIEILDDNIFLATNKGLIKFPKNINCKNAVIPNIQITSIYVNDSLVHDNKNLTLPYNNKNVKINLSSISLKSRGNYHYQYRLAGLDSKWSSLKAALPYVIFSSIPSGEYTFQVKAINEDGIESEIKEININIKTPFWQRWWFYVLITIATSALVATFFFNKNPIHQKKRNIAQ